MEHWRKSHQYVIHQYLYHYFKEVRYANVQGNALSAAWCQRVLLVALVEGNSVDGKIEAIYEELDLTVVP